MSSWLRVLGVCLLLAGCSGGGGSSAPPADPVASDTASLQAFSSAAELQDYFSGQVVQRSGDVPLPVAGAPVLDGTDSGPLAPSFPAQGEGGFSGTTVQEVGVDESDVVKTDGQFIYILTPAGLRIVRATPPDAMAEVARLPLPGYGREIYLHGNLVVALGETWGGFGPVVDPFSGVPASLGDTAPGLSAFFAYSRPTAHVSIIDVTDRAAPQRIFTTTFDGSLATSRMIGDILHLVVANYPQYFYDVLPALGMTAQEGHMADGSAVDAQTMLPEFVFTAADGSTRSGDVLTWQTLYHPVDPDGFGTLALISMDVTGGGDFDAVGVVADPGVIYSSLDALYLTDTAYDGQGDARTTTDIYKFAYSDGAAVPRGVGTVPGRILNQYALGEYAGFLRVATTIDPQWNVDGKVFTQSSNGVYVLGETNGALAVVGSIEGIAPGETVQSAHFVGARGFLVTFRQIDPLFTLDLADPANPAIEGELKLPGFSTFMTVLDDKHLLTVGRYVPEEGPTWPQQVQLSIIDVSDMSRPLQQHNVIIDAGREVWSEALWNPKALTWFPQQGLLALPLGVEPQLVGVPEGDAAGAAERFAGVAVFRVDADSGFAELGRLDMRFDEFGSQQFTRGLFIGDALYGVTDRGLRAVQLGAMDAAPWELQLAPDDMSPGYIE